MHAIRHFFLTDRRHARRRVGNWDGHDLGFTTE
jgi:hypothetical protein